MITGSEDKDLTEEAIARLSAKQKTSVPEMGPAGGPSNPAPHISPKQKPKKKPKPRAKGERAEISDPIYDELNSQRAKDRSDMRKADAIKEKFRKQKQDAMKAAVKAGR